jgi:uncharacterized membrane protein
VNKQKRSSVKEISAKDALALWEQAGLIAPDQRGKLTRYLDEKAPPRANASARAVKIVSAFGAVLVGLGLMLFVASHWSDMGTWLRIATLFCAYAAVVAMAAVTGRRGYRRVAGSLWFLATLTVGANIFLLGQIFNLSLTFWQGPFLWMLAALALGYALGSRLHAWLVLPLGILALAWAGGGEAWFSDDQWRPLISVSGLRPLYPVLGLALVSLALLARRLEGWRFASGTWLVWGALLTTAHLVAATLDSQVLWLLFQIALTPKQWLVLAIGAGLIVGALVLARFEASANRLLLGLAAVLVFTCVASAAADWLPKEGGVVFPLFILAVAGMSLYLVWGGLAAADPRMVNLGIASAATVVLIQYFSWSFRLLDRSLAFIFGGLVLIVLSVWIERQRRWLLARIAP